MSITLEEEKRAVDLVTDAMFSVSFLDAVNKRLFHPTDSTPSRISLKDFYTWWLKEVDTLEPKMPFSLGIFIGYVFCGLLITKENWSDLLPVNTISKLDPDWGLKDVKCVATKESNPNLVYVVRRLRNALGHANFSVHVPTRQEIGDNLDLIHDLTLWTFKDSDPKDESDIFEITLTMRQIELLIKKFHSIVHQTVRKK